MVLPSLKAPRCANERMRLACPGGGGPRAFYHPLPIFDGLAPTIFHPSALSRCLGGQGTAWSLPGSSENRKGAQWGIQILSASPVP